MAADSTSWDSTLAIVVWLSGTKRLLSENRCWRRVCQIVHSKVSGFSHGVLITLLWHYQLWKQTKNKPANKKSPLFLSQINNASILEMQRKQICWKINISNRKKLYIKYFYNQNKVFLFTGWVFGRNAFNYMCINFLLLYICFMVLPRTLRPEVRFSRLVIL